MKSFSLIVIGCLLFFSCQRTDQREVPDKGPVPLPVIRIDETTPSRSLKLSEVMDLERIVPLETRPDLSLPDHFTTLITDKYIILVVSYSEGKGNILEFSSNGKFIRTLSNQGGGPHEYEGLGAIAVDSKNEKLFYSHRGDREHIVVIDLNSGYFLEPIQLPLDTLQAKDDFYLNKILVRNDGTLLCSPHWIVQANSGVFGLSPTGEFLGGFSRPLVAISNPKLAGALWFISDVAGKIHYLQPLNDTLYKIENWKKTPVAVFDVRDQFESKINRGVQANETMWQLRIEGKTFYTVFSLDIFRHPSGSVTSSVLPRNYYIPKGRAPILINDLELDYLGFSLSSGQNLLLELRPSGDHLVAITNAPEFKQHAAEVLKAGTAPPDVLARVKKLDQQVNENDNPILLIGKMK